MLEYGSSSQGTVGTLILIALQMNGLDLSTKSSSSGNNGAAPAAPAAPVMNAGERR